MRDMDKFQILVQIGQPWVKEISYNHIALSKPTNIMNYQLIVDQSEPILYQHA